jgi:transposase
MVFVKRTYTAEQVKLALRVYHSVQSFRRASANTGIPKSTIHRWTCRLGRVIDWNKTKKRRITRCNARFDSCHQVLLDLLRGCPFKPLKTLQCELHARNINLSISTLHRYIRTLNYTYQKISWRKPPRDVSCEKNRFGESYALF